MLFVKILPSNHSHFIIAPASHAAPCRTPHDRRRILATTAAPITISAIACKPIAAANTPTGAGVAESNSARSVGAALGAGGVKRDPEGSVAKFAAIACGVAAAVGDGKTIGVIVAVGSGEGVGVGDAVGVEVGGGVSVGSGVGVSVGCGVAVGAVVPVGVAAAARVALGLRVGITLGLLVGVGEAGVGEASVETSNVRDIFVPRFNSSRYSTVMVLVPDALDN